MSTQTKDNTFNIAEALLIVSLAYSIRGHKYAIVEAAKRIKNRCDEQARSFVVDYVLKASDPVQLIKRALGELELFYTDNICESEAA